MEARANEQIGQMLFSIAIRAEEADVDGLLLTTSPANTIFFRWARQCCSAARIIYGHAIQYTGRRRLTVHGPPSPFSSW